MVIAKLLFAFWVYFIQDIVVQYREGEEGWGEENGEGEEEDEGDKERERGREG